ncbi:MAG: biopolymer transporter Tol, partial [Candidatus Krumholzibacteriia bacterium]
MRKWMFLAATLWLALVPSRSVAWNQSEISWLTITTEHFCVQYHKGLERYAEHAAAVAESVYGPVTEMYGYKPDGKIYLNLSDVEDESQGVTYYYLNRIDITVTPYDFWFRGSAAWISNVIAHEFTHMVSVQSSFKYSRRIPSLYLQAVNFEKEKRPDVIYGYPNLQMSIPIPGEILPGWFAEGMAQYQCSGACHDMWDSHRDMLLRTAFASGTLLTIDEMGVFGKNSRASEMVYNQGFSLAGFVARRFGADKLRDLALAFSSMRRWGFDGACEHVLALSDEELYRMWKEDLSAKYDPVLSG